MSPLLLTPDGVKVATGRTFVLWVVALLASISSESKILASGMEAWRPVSAALLQEKTPAIDPNAPAEVLEWTLKIDDSERPQRSTIHEYIRYKIFDPERAVNLTRVSATGYSNYGSDYRNVDVRARLILPNGTQKEFGKESIQERDLVKSANNGNWVSRVFGPAGVEMKEKFLAIGAIEPGSIVEFQYQTRQDYPGPFYAFLLQRNGVPVRSLKFEQVFADSGLYSTSATLLNSSGLDVKETASPQKTSITVTAANLPAYENETFDGPIYSRVLTFIGNYRPRGERLITVHPFEAREFPPNSSPWVGFATMGYLGEQDLTRPTLELKKLANTITAGATTDDERALRIHRYVRDLYQKFLKGSQNGAYRPNFALPEAGEVAEYSKHADQHFWPVNFLYLAVALYREAGLQTQVLLLPDCNFVFFSPKLTSNVFLPGACARVLVGASWKYSMPQTEVPLPFDSLPWNNRGGVALIAQDSKAEFIDVPEAPASETDVTNSGKLELGADGSLGGRCSRVVSGEVAARVRKEMGNEVTDEVKRRLADGVRDEIKADTLTVVSVDGLGEPDKPVSFDFDVHWDNYAEATKERIIFRPSVFHGLSNSLFSDDVRHNRIIFPYKWADHDNLTIQLPQGYSFEAPSIPPSQPGKVFDYEISISVYKKSNRIAFTRTFTNNGEVIPAAAYPVVKQWFDSMAESDGHELILVKAAMPQAAGAGAQSAKQ
jgi:hypothetical protein